MAQEDAVSKNPCLPIIFLLSDRYVTFRNLIKKYSSVPLDVLTSESDVERFINLVEITMAAKHRVNY